MSFSTKKKTAAMHQWVKSLDQTLLHQHYALTIQQVVQEILARPPTMPGLAPTPPANPVQTCD
jgi:hypothetical protein